MEEQQKETIRSPKEKKKSRRTKKKKEEELGLGLDVNIESVKSRPPKRGGCTSGGSTGGRGGLKVEFGLDIVSKTKKEKKQETRRREDRKDDKDKLKNTKDDDRSS